MKIIGSHAVLLATSILQLAWGTATSETVTSTSQTVDAGESALPPSDPPSIASHTTATSSTTLPPSSSSPASAITAGSSAPYPSQSTCPFRTINWVTHSLPQQCLKTSRAPLGAETRTLQDDTFAGPWALQKDDENVVAYRTPLPIENISNSSLSTVSSIEHSATSTIQAHVQASTVSSQALEIESDSPLDNANFLSFEEWKKQNLAKVGQSPENVGQGRPSGEPRRRPGINNALDTLGEDTEIDIDFGFGTPNSGPGETWSQGSPSLPVEDRPKEGVDVSTIARSKDAGKTCKERFNYASFDCAATVLKTNPQCKSSSSVLVENKDSYMLNECRAQNKFIIVELCEDILVDTVVLGNFEFFSSMFRTFRVSVSDRYPVKMDAWKVLGIFEARNSRDIQAFLVDQPLIWARYLRVEFLTQYGSEYYCPVSLLRVHGTTMMEEFKIQEDISRGEYYEEPIEHLVDGGVISGVPAVEVPSNTAPPLEPVKPLDSEVVLPPLPSEGISDAGSANYLETSTTSISQSSAEPENISAVSETTSNPSDVNSESSSTPTSEAIYTEKLASTTAFVNGTLTVTEKRSEPPSTAPAKDSVNSASPADTSVEKNSTIPKSTKDSATPVVPNSPVPKKPIQENGSHRPSSQMESNQIQPQQPSGNQRPTAPNPPAANPTTQESFYKSTLKRVQQLEANSTLSLKYIEEQSRILRDAFVQVEKRQLAKIETFLQTLNSTVMTEMQGFRHQYDMLWQSTVLELESQRERHDREMYAISSRLSIMADEYVFTKRMSVVQSILLLLCLCLVLFVRSGTATGLEVPIYQQVSQLRDSWRSGSPPLSPPQAFARLRATMSEVNIRRVTPSSSSSPTDDEGEASKQSSQRSPASSPPLLHSPPPEVHIEPPSPESLPDAYPQTQSGPATPRGSRDKSAMWNETPVEERCDPFADAERLQESSQTSHTNDQIPPLTNGV